MVVLKRICPVFVWMKQMIQRDAYGEMLTASCIQTVGFGEMLTASCTQTVAYGK